MSIISPITGSANTKITHTIPVKQIVELYGKDLKIDVSSYFQDLSEIAVVECLDTGYVFYHPFNVFGDESFYNLLKVRLPELYNSPYYSDWKWEYDLSKKFIRPSDNIYEIGAGNGYFLEHLLKNGFSKVSGSELNHESVNEGRKKGLDIEYLEIEQKANQAENNFDVVCCFQVLEHISNIKPFLESAIKILKHSGTLIIAVPFNDPFLFRNDMLNTLNLPPHHMGLWGTKAFKSLPKFYSLKVEDIIVERLAGSGYDFERFFEVNKDTIFSARLPFKSVFNKVYKRWLRYFHSSYSGKNIIAVFKKI